MPTSLIKPPRNIWQAIRELFEQAHELRDADMWDRAYRLWVYASATRAPGVPFQITTYRPVWLP